MLARQRGTKPGEGKEVTPGVANDLGGFGSKQSEIQWCLLRQRES